MSLKIAINGFGRIGRATFKQALENNIEVVAINDLGSLENLAYLLKHDSAYGLYSKEVSTKQEGKNNFIVVDNKKYPLFAIEEPEKLPWGSKDVDIVVESTGIFTTTKKANAHIRAGAKRVVMSAPSKDEETPNILMGSNSEELITKDLPLVTSNASCTTNAVTPLMTILSDSLGIKKSLMTTIHGYTATQSLVDSSVKGDDFLRGRAAAMNMIPSHTGAAKATVKALPNLQNLFDALSVRVPVITGSLVDLVVLVEHKTTVEEVNHLFKEASRESRWKEILGFSETPLASTDIIGNTHATIVDATHTKVVDGDLVKILSWYDNEWGLYKLFNTAYKRSW